jgi:hypothetical protein
MALLGISEAARLIGRDAETVEPRPRLFWYTRCPLEFRWSDLVLVLLSFYPCAVGKCRQIPEIAISPGAAPQPARADGRP